MSSTGVVYDLHDVVRMLHELLVKVEEIYVMIEDLYAISNNPCNCYSLDARFKKWVNSIRKRNEKL